VANDICRSVVLAPRYLPERRYTAFPHHYTLLSAIQLLILKALKASQMSSLREAYILSYHQTVMYIHSETERQ